MNKIKSVKVLHVVGAMNRAGTETMLMNIYRNVDRNKIQFHFLTFGKEDAYYDNEIKKKGGTIIRIARPTSILGIFKAMKENGPYAAVHSHTLFHSGIAILAATLAGVKIRITHSHTTLGQNGSITRKIYNNTMRFLINKLSTNLLACSENAGIYLFGKKSLRASNYRFFPNPIDVKKFIKENRIEIEDFKLENGLDKGLVIGHIGRFVEAKNHTFILKIMKSICEKRSGAQLLLVGDGHLRNLIEEEASNLGLINNIKFVGSRNDIPILLKSMDVFIFPSIYEGLGLVLLEAQAAGVPCIISEAIQPEADLNMNLMIRLSLKDSPEIWAEKILAMNGNKLEDPSEIINVFERTGYSINKGISNLLEIYEVKQEVK